VTISKRALAAIAGLLAFLLLGAASCDDTPSSTTSESQVQRNSYDAQVKRQPAHSMHYSPTRDTINFWIDTWDDPNAVSYVYLQGGDGTLLGYYVLKGRPVTMCAALTPTWQFVGTPKDGSDVRDQRVPAPGVDGVYYSGGQCNDYYGETTDGVYVEFTVGTNQNILLYTAPLPQANNVPNLAPTGR
jgi:hypothetical protein